MNQFCKYFQMLQNEKVSICQLDHPINFKLFLVTVLLLFEGELLLLFRHFNLLLRLFGALYVGRDPLLSKREAIGI